MYMKRNIMMYLEDELISKIKDKKIDISPLVNQLLRQYININTPTKEEEYIKKWEDIGEKKKKQDEDDIKNRLKIKYDKKIDNLTKDRRMLLQNGKNEDAELIKNELLQLYQKYSHGILTEDDIDDRRS